MRNVWTALGALAAGAAAMYLSDPEQGAQRRAGLRHRFAAAADGAMDTLQSAGAQASDRLDQAAQDGRGLLQEVLNRLQDIAQQGRLSSRQALHEAEATAREARDRLPTRWEEPDVPPARRADSGGGLLLTVSGLVVGAAAIYLLKTEQGRRRLARVREQARQLGQRVTHRQATTAAHSEGETPSADQGAPQSSPDLSGNRPPVGTPPDQQSGAALH
jgi:gas vesicle protein